MSAATAGSVARKRRERRPPRFLSARSGRVSASVLLLVLGLAFVGPAFSPHSPSELVGPPYQSPSGAYPLGTDYLGEDVLSRVLSGGWRLVVLASIATIVAYVIGGIAGLLAGYSRSLIDPILMRSVDLLLAFPAILLLLLLAVGFGGSLVVVVVGIVLVQLPLVARVVRTATLETSVRGYVEAAAARGDSTWSIMTREILPNIWGPISADAGPRFTISILLVAALNYLGLGVSPPSPDWAVMINENRSGITLNPYALAVPAALIALLTVSANVLADSIARSLGRSVDVDSLRR